MIRKALNARRSIMAQGKKKKVQSRRPATRGSAKSKKIAVAPKKRAGRHRMERSTQRKTRRNIGSRGPVGERLREVNPEQTPNQPGIGERMDEGYRLSQEGQEGSSVPMADILESQERHRPGRVDAAKELKRKINNPADDSGEEETTAQSGDL